MSLALRPLSPGEVPASAPLAAPVPSALGRPLALLNIFLILRASLKEEGEAADGAAPPELPLLLDRS